MFSRYAFRILVTVAVVVVLTVSALQLHAQQSKVASAEKAPGKFVVHEWGTFTSLAKADGKPMFWNSLIGASELPSFVYRTEEARKAQCIKCSMALARMETPVLYFYADRETNVSVKVDFPQGRITEWYPFANVTRSQVAWENFTVMPNALAAFPMTQEKSHYYPARATDADPIRVKVSNGEEQEKFLFYRGLGDFTQSVNAGLRNHKVDVRNVGAEPIAEVIVFENRRGKSGWRKQHLENGETLIERPALQNSVESLHRELESMLMAQGLYRREAKAMVRTWNDSWFEEGLRVLYIVPRRKTDAVLPITVNPAPTELVRVLVGRAEIITPQMENEIRAAIEQFHQGEVDQRVMAVETVRRYGRFAEPVLREIIGTRRMYADSIQKLTAAAMTKSASGGN
jgi:hypothetical protein